MLPRHLLSPLTQVAARLPHRSSSGVAGVCRASAITGRPAAVALTPRRLYSDTTADTTSDNTTAATQESTSPAEPTSSETPPPPSSEGRAFRKYRYKGPKDPKDPKDPKQPEQPKPHESKKSAKSPAESDTGKVLFESEDVVVYSKPKNDQQTTQKQPTAAPAATQKPGRYSTFTPERLASVQQILETKPNLWLRDACPCEKCVDPHSGQKSFATTQLSLIPEVKSVERADNGSLTVVWANDPVSGGQDHTSVYPPTIEADANKFLRRDLWDRRIYDREYREKCRVSYSDWMAGGSEFWTAMAALSAKGLIFVYDVPQGDEAAVERIGEQIGKLQETFYGRTWDVVSKPQAENVAYTNQFLGLHQDLLYYPDPPRIQLLHCLANDCEGGDSLFSDGIFSATAIRNHRPFTYNQLTTQPTAYHYNKNGNVHYAERPVVDALRTTTFQEDANHTAINSVWWSPPFQAPFPLNNTKLATWHLAAQQFQAEIERPVNIVQHRLQAGECVVFDNWRVLHGRKEFDPQSGNRHLKGTYVDDRTFRARFEDMPEMIAAQEGVWTDLAKEYLQSRRVVLADRRSRRFLATGSARQRAADDVLRSAADEELTVDAAVDALKLVLGRKAEPLRKDLEEVLVAYRKRFDKSPHKVKKKAQRAKAGKQEKEVQKQPEGPAVPAEE